MELITTAFYAGVEVRTADVRGDNEMCTAPVPVLGLFALRAVETVRRVRNARYEKVLMALYLMDRAAR